MSFNRRPPVHKCVNCHPIVSAARLTRNTEQEPICIGGFQHRLSRLEQSRCTDILDIYFNIPEHQRTAFKQVLEETLLLIWAWGRLRAASMRLRRRCRG